MTAELVTADIAWRAQAALETLVPPIPMLRRLQWQKTYTAALRVADAATIFIAGAVASLLTFHNLDMRSGDGTQYLAHVLLLAPCWLGLLAFSGGYDRQILGHGPDEFKRALNALARFTAVAAGFAYLTAATVNRTFFASFVLGVTAMTMLSRAGLRQTLRYLRHRGRAMRNVLIVGTPGSAFPMAARLLKETSAGFRVVGLCAAGGVDRRDRALSIAGQRERRAVRVNAPIIGNLSEVASVVRRHLIDTVAVAPSAGMTPEALRLLAWELEDSGVDLIVAPALVDVAGPRIHMTPVAGLPLLHVSTPHFSGFRRVIKTVQDLSVAGVAAVLLSPVLLVVGLMVRFGSRGPVFFTQERVGQGGRTFRVIKFRSMYVDAEQRLAEVAADNEHDAGPLFKMKNDPRVTKIGAHLRRWSLDELPQLFNVLRGDMSLVGPRPPLLDEVLAYDSKSVYRRLMVKPGLTGLWQISGRSDLPWHEAVRLDLYYVENWSPALDVSILWRTAGAVLAQRGAY